MKDDLLKTFIDSEYESLPSKEETNTSEIRISPERVNGYRNKIQDLEDENDLLRNKYEYLEREATDLETKESVLIENCFRELGKRWF